VRVDVDLVIDMDGKSFGDDLVALQITELLCKIEVSLDWMW